MSINETMLTEKNDYTPEMKGYKILRNDRKNKPGGVALIIKYDIKIKNCIKNENIEAITISIEDKNNKILNITSFYKAPNKKLIYEELNKILERPNSIICSDINTKNTLWGSNNTTKKERN